VDRSEATFQAFDGVTLTLEDGRAVNVRSFSTQEAVRYLRLLSMVEAGDAGAHATFMREFPARAGLSDVPLSAFGFTFDVEGVGEVAGGSVTVSRALELVELLNAAQTHHGWRQQCAFLGEFPGAFGLADLNPPEVFRAGIAFEDEVNRLLYGLAESFLTHLASSPRAQVMRTRGTEGSGSTPASTT
jgi:hypothetical protein